ncbi:MAG: glycine dehydrogenase, partial [Gammaproteobacteria bacterium]|nr:glycine dehydrogenase [Gammaproteobacteria bacterium]
MPFIPHTEQEIAEMLQAIGVDDINALFEEIPSHLLAGELTGVPEGMTEMEISRLMHARASQHPQSVCFLGAGAYEH